MPDFDGSLSDEEWAAAALDDEPDEWELGISYASDAGRGTGAGGKNKGAWYLDVNLRVVRDKKAAPGKPVPERRFTDPSTGRKISEETAFSKLAELYARADGVARELARAFHYLSMSVHADKVDRWQSEVDRLASAGDRLDKSIGWIENQFAAPSPEPAPAGISRDEALRAFDYFIRTGENVKGLNVHAVHWHGAAHEENVVRDFDAQRAGMDPAEDAEALRAPLIEMLDKHQFRLGAVKK